ncbi:zinc finger CCCH domain-containing protein 10-like [Stegodyphus dumicola]|uniref:zinc finger CCCH domain-containing protein 10-like n=1 Tax=Stegodyphus dumicola TaxID=202533 RepID=UPI0015A98389|nr:zinc finger CCCH domain-containing protein 10-like [Stegodyphus dumicola]XP_035232803.1 zinc finger CCCH domain-containing protein 10-like [Stegodyphus dumicola]XP_035232804.1 zinc finger CCCH domain-containing protein 10-like [Stegodyphus dumicola]
MSEGNMLGETDKVSLNGDDNDSKESVCRDFLRNVCKRGKFCRFKHPEGDEAEALGKKEIVFCHDFQNKECRRPNCKFMHCTKQEEEIFRSTGRLPAAVLESKANKIRMQNAKIPICKDYLKGECRRAGRCKFRHLSAFELQIESNNQNNNHLRRDRFDNSDQYDTFIGYEPQAKRRAYENSFSDGTFPLGERRPMMSQHYRMLEEENAMLLHKIEELKKQVVDLTATNEFLLDQNAQLRVSKQTLVSPISQQLIPHTLTPTMPSLPAPSITQLSQIPLSSDLGAASLTPDLTLGQGIAPVSIAPSQVTLPTISAASLSQSLPQTIITSTALISYPIMTQSMRPVIPHSLG